MLARGRGKRRSVQTRPVPRDAATRKAAMNGQVARREFERASESAEPFFDPEPSFAQENRPNSRLGSEQASMDDVWEAFCWTDATKQNMPFYACRTDRTLRDSISAKKWSTMIQSARSAMIRVTEILYPAEPDSLIADVLGGGSAAPISTEDQRKVQKVFVGRPNRSGRYLR